MGHAENKCEVQFAMENDDGWREWSAELRAEGRGQGSRPVSQWLKAEVGRSSAAAGGSGMGADHSG
ncbi:hypothetical protein A2U01_0079241, partial [Trifolium medium]|nr:hypothetical protein [Trifolium medium]